jgi:hypothetical protein
MAQSSKNTESGSDKLPALVQAGEPTKRDEQIGILERRVERLQDERLEERWFWLAACAFFADCALLPHMNGFAAIAILLLEFTYLILLAKRWGVDDVLEAMSQVADLFRRVKDTGKEG